MPGRTPATSSTGAPAARAGVRGLAGHFSLPRASSATCAAVALPVAAAADGRDAAWPVADPPPDFPDSPEPQAASVQPVTSAIAKTHFCMSVVPLPSTGLLSTWTAMEQQGQGRCPHAAFTNS